MMRDLIRFLRHRQNILGLVIVTGFVATALAAPSLAPAPPGEEFSPYRQVENLKSHFPVSPNAEVRLGTVPTGILGGQLDVYYTAVWGTRSALKFGLLAALGTAALGVLLGALSAYWGGLANNLIMRVTDAFLAFPVVVGVVVFQQILQVVNAYALMHYFEQPGAEPAATGPLQRLFESIDPVMLALIVFSWMGYARLTNTMVMSLKNTAFVEAAQALGAGGLRIVARHLIPNAISPAIVLAARDIGGMVLMQATLTFIGIGGGSEWGTLLATGRRWIIGPGGNPLAYWWVFIPATLALILFGVGWNLLGDGLNDWLNPKADAGGIL